MTEHELNLIAEYAAGSLQADEVDAVEAKIASDPAARAEYEAQRAALDALGSAPAVQMTDEERTAMRAAVAEELHIVREEPVEEPASWWRRPIPWARLGTAAAVLAAVVIAAPFISTLSTSGDSSDETFGEISAEATVAATTVNRTNQDAAAPPAGDVGSAEETVPAATLSTEAPQTEDGLVPSEAVPPSLVDFGDQTPTQLAALSRSLRSKGGVNALTFDQMLSEGGTEREGVAVEPDILTLCPAEIDEAVPGFENAVFLGFARLEGTPALLVFVTPAGGGDDVLVVFDEATCEVLAQFGP